MQSTPEEIERCRAAMSKPAPREALALIASGRLVFEIEKSGDIMIDTLDGKKLRDPDTGRKMGLSGAWPLYRAGMIDQFGRITDAGQELLAAERGN